MISNNLADQAYLKEESGVDSLYIPSLCMYTDAKYNHIHKEFVLFDDKVKDKFKSIEDSSILIERPKNYEYKNLFEYAGIVHMPYDVSTMSLFEQYFAGVPLFFPTKDFYKECILNATCTFIFRYDKGGVDGVILPAEEIDKWLQYTDYYNFKYINYY